MKRYNVKEMTDERLRDAGLFGGMFLRKKVVQELYDRLKETQHKLHEADGMIESPIKEEFIGWADPDTMMHYKKDYAEEDRC